MDSFCALQITDTHLTDDPAAAVDGVNIEECLTRLLTSAQHSTESIDCLILSGDLADVPNQSSYPAIYRRLEQIVHE